MVRLPKNKIRRHYDLVSPFYQKLWSNHIHHGYYKTGKEPKKIATENFLKYLINKSPIRRGSKVLDIGCGVGGTSIYLAKNYTCKVDGLTISSVQVELATKEASKLKENQPNFFVKDANNLDIKEGYDSIFAIEMISHLDERKSFFRNISRLLKRRGKIYIAAWLKDSNLSKSQIRRYIKPIEQGMMVDLPDLEEYINYFKNNNLKLRYSEDISNEVKQTWDITLDIIKQKKFWDYALKYGKDVVDFLKAFVAMKRGFNSSTFRYYIFILEK